jgi:hypothetical protein
MRRREFLTSLFGGTAVGAPFFAGGASPSLPLYSAQPSDEALAARCERLLLQVQEANRRFAEANEQLAQVYYKVHQMNNALTIVRFSEDFAWNEMKPSDETRRDLDVAWNQVCGLLKAVFADGRAWSKRVSADVIS